MSKRRIQSKSRLLKNELTFRETLAATPSAPVLPDLGEHLRQGAREAWRYACAVGVTTASYGTAVAQDAAYFGSVAARGAWNKQSRRLYLTLLVVGGGVSLAVATFLGISTLSLYASDITSPATLIAKKDTGITLLDRNGQLLYRAYGAANRTTITTEQTPKHLVAATLASEDPHFYDHPGFSWQATGRAIYVDLTKGRRAEGGSTLTQQLVKNALLTSHKTFERKFQEILLSVALERRYDKDEILNMYLNETYYGEGSYGIAAAAQTYFHKTPDQLSLGETALLAGLPLGPSRFNPNIHPEEAIGRRNYVLRRMVEFGHISPEAAKAAEAEPLATFSQAVVINAPHFVFYVLDQLRAQYGDTMVEQGGMTVVTTLDLAKQNQAQEIIQNQIKRIAFHNVTNGALVSLDPATGDIISMAGSLDYNAPGFGNVNVTISSRQPGSSFKPFAYVTAFKKGWNGTTQIQDTPLSLPAGDGTMYTPQNYDGRFHGTVTARHAIDNSLNIPAIKAIQFAGIDPTIQTARDLGITTLTDTNRYGVSLVLGAGEVRPLELAAAYGGFATGGLKVTPRAVLQIRNRTGKTTYSAAATDQPRVLDARLAYMMSHILSDNNARQPEFPANSPLKLSRPAAAKTGTTNDFRDNWTVGYTPNLVTAVWVGNNDNSAMQGVDGITGAAPIWHDYMEMALAGTPVQQFVPPAGVSLLAVCPFDGGLSGPGQPAITEVFLSEAMPTRRCSYVPPAPSPKPSATPDAASNRGEGNNKPEPPTASPPPISDSGDGSVPSRRGFFQ